ncbi:HAD family phosphatase [Chrysosporum ovalisporum APH033B]|uniref:HAD family hydrolase n=1 Tax=Umezakia ovalisporum TaxID=75695 RepID=UPI0024761F0D|nr:HAD family phosphatase [Umezakia ovalisporum]MDH6067192.1 HAD family phosphatase [Umezakia ovalisporum APH033B]
MSLKAVLFDFNGVIIDDGHIHSQLLDQILIEENLQPQKMSEGQVSLGRSDRGCWQELLQNRGRTPSVEYINKLLHRKAQAYVQELEKIEKLPLYPGVEDLIYQVRWRNIKLGLVSGATRLEIKLVLEKANLEEYFPVIVAGDDITTSKPEPEGYLLAIERLNQKYSDLNLQPQECLAIEDTPGGIKAAEQAQIQVVGVANTYPFHMLHRWCNWTVDCLSDLDLSQVQELYGQKNLKLTKPGC